MNIINRLLMFLKRLRPSAHLDPVRDWLASITLSTIVLAGIIVWNVWAFDTIANGGDIGAAVPATPALFNRAPIETIHTIFANRADEEAKYVTGVYSYADPSL